MTIANDTYGLSFQFNAPVCFSRPNSLSDFSISTLEVIHQAKEHTNGMFANGIAVTLGGIDEDDPFLGGISLVDIIHTRT